MGCASIRTATRAPSLDCLALQRRPDLESENSGQVVNTHPVDSVRDDDFGVFAVTEMATETPGAVVPIRRFPGPPNATYVDL
jgi:hypothetical protein